MDPYLYISPTLMHMNGLLEKWILRKLCPETQILKVFLQFTEIILIIIHTVVVVVSYSYWLDHLPPQNDERWSKVP